MCNCTSYSVHSHCKQINPINAWHPHCVWSKLNIVRRSNYSRYRSETFRFLQRTVSTTQYKNICSLHGRMVRKPSVYVDNNVVSRYKYIRYESLVKNIYLVNRVLHYVQILLWNTEGTFYDGWSHLTGIFWKIIKIILCGEPVFSHWQLTAFKQALIL